MAINEEKLGAFMNKVVGDLGATIGAAMVVIGDRLGLYKAMAGAGPLTAAELSKKAGTAERYTQEWLLNQAAGGYIEYNEGSHSGHPKKNLGQIRKLGQLMCAARINR